MDQYNIVEGYGKQNNIQWKNKDRNVRIKPEATAQDRSQT